MKSKHVLLITTLGAVCLVAPQADLAMRPPGALTDEERQIQNIINDEPAQVVNEPAKVTSRSLLAEQETAPKQKTVSVAESDSNSDQRLLRAPYELAQATVSGGGGSSGGTTLATGLGGEPLNTFFRGGSSTRALIIRSSETEAKDQSALEKDLAIMSHLLDKALEDNVGRQAQEHKAMGINVYFASSVRPIRSMFLDGYGALFMVNVGLPLLPPASKPETAKEEGATDSAWQEAERELYGRGPESKTFGAAAEPYDEEKVDKLKDALLEALKNAANIRNLKPEDSITVCVFGSAAGGMKKTRTISRTTSTSNRRGDQPQVWIANTAAPQRGSVMTIRVKKADADAFSKGKLELEDFRKRAKIVAYPGDLSGENPSLFFGSEGSGGYGYGLGR